MPKLASAKMWKRQGLLLPKCGLLSQLEKMAKKKWIL
jgi:hypothetical protein